MTAIAESNGHAPETDPLADVNTLQLEAEERMESFAGEMIGLLEDERALIVRLQNSLTACREREKRIVKAIAALEGTVPEPREPRQPKASSTRKRYASPELRDQILAALVELGEARISQIVDKTGRSEPSTRQAIELLRADEKVRIVRQDKALGVFYAPMPGATDGS